MFRVFANDLGDRDSISRLVKPKTKKMILDASLLNTQHYKVSIRGNQYRERSKALSYTFVW